MTGWGLCKVAGLRNRIWNVINPRVGFVSIIHAEGVCFGLAICVR